MGGTAHGDMAPEGVAYYVNCLAARQLSTAQRVSDILPLPGVVEVGARLIGAPQIQVQHAQPPLPRFMTDAAHIATIAVAPQTVQQHQSSARPGGRGPMAAQVKITQGLVAYRRGPWPPIGLGAGAGAQVPVDGPKMT